MNNRDMYFLSKNYINSDDTINVSSGDDYKSYIYDQNKSVQWESSGETSETGYDTYIEIIFYEGLSTVNRTYDTIVLQNINLKKFKLQNYNGSYADISGASYTVNADSTVRIKLASSVTGSRIKLLMQSTISSGEEKKVGQFWVMLETYQLQNPRTTRSRQVEVEGDFYRLGDGTGEQWSIYEKWNKKYTFKYLSDTQIDELYDIYNEHEEFSFYEDYTRDIDSIRLVHWIGKFKDKDDARVELHTLNMELVEL